jgi:hypothetical protein
MQKAVEEILPATDEVNENSTADEVVGKSEKQEKRKIEYIFKTSNPEIIVIDDNPNPFSKGTIMEQTMEIRVMRIANKKLAAELELWVQSVREKKAEKARRAEEHRERVEEERKRVEEEENRKYAEQLAREREAQARKEKKKLSSFFIF